MTLMDLKVLPSREVVRQSLEDAYSTDGEDGLVKVLDEVVWQLSREPFNFPDACWMVHYDGPGLVCCHISATDDPMDEEGPHWAVKNRGMAAAMVLVIEQFIDWCRGDDLPSLGDIG